MKKLAIVSFVLGVIALAAGFYCYQWLVPSIEAYERLLTHLKVGTEEYGIMRAAEMAESDKKDLYSLISIITGGLGFIAGVFSGVKKANLGWIGAILALAGLLLGLITGTHMFS